MTKLNSGYHFTRPRDAPLGMAKITKIYLARLKFYLEANGGQCLLAWTKYWFGLLGLTSKQAHKA